VAAPVAAPISPFEGSDSTPLLTIHRRGPGPRLGRLILLILLVAVILSGGYFGTRWLLENAATEHEGVTSEGVHEAVKNNFRFAFPSGWKPDGKLRRALGANFALRGTEPNSGVAIFVREYKSKLPDETELRNQAVTWLEKYFHGLEWEPGPVDSLDGEFAKAIAFQGEADQVLINGECIMASHQGRGYWFVAWGPAEQRDKAVQKWPTLRGGFQFLDKHPGKGKS
jgi:hypothetical protein